MDKIQEFVSAIIQWSVILFVFVIGLGVLYVLTLYIIDKSQTTHTIRRNYPVIGRFRYFFEHLGEFFRQYFFALDREELPFNRAERSWAYRAAKNVDSTIAFGSTRSLTPSGEIVFLNCPFPEQVHDTVKPELVTIGEGYVEKPYSTHSLFNISGMSYGALSAPAVQALSHGAKKAGIWMNTGEGGLSPYHLEGGCDLVFQIGTAKYGVRNEQGEISTDKVAEVAKHAQVKMFEIKLSQGAKPGKGGILPGEKVSKAIADIRGIEEGKDSISPNGHLDVSDSYTLLDLIDKVRKASGKPVGIKMVVGRIEYFDALFKIIHERGIASAPDFITIDSADGGTGAAPQSLMDYVGMPLRESLPMVVDKLNQYNLRSRIKVIASGKLITPSSVAWALAAGADFICSARGFMFSLGCIQALQCNKNTCPTGITTHDPRFQRGLVAAKKSHRVASYAKNMMYEVGVIAHSCGVPKPQSLKRHHMRVITDLRGSEIFADIYPDQKPLSNYE